MKYLCSLLAVLLVGCASSSQERYSRLEVGMTKQQVINLLGPPKSTKFNGALVTMEYDLGWQQPGILHPEQPPHTSCYVIIGREDGRVRSFGRN